MAYTMAAAVTRRANALRAEAPDGNAESGRASLAADSPAAKRAVDAKDDVWVAADEGVMSGDGNRPMLFRTMKVKGSILHPYRSIIIPHGGFHTIPLYLCPVINIVRV